MLSFSWTQSLKECLSRSGIHVQLHLHLFIASKVLLAVQQELCLMHTPSANNPVAANTSASIDDNAMEACALECE